MSEIRKFQNARYNDKKLFSVHMNSLPHLGSFQTCAGSNIAGS